MITNAQQILTKAHQDNYAVLHVNVINYDMAACAIQTAQKANAPIIVAVSENALKKCFCGAGDFADMINKIDAYFHITVPVIIHLDHGKYETVETCIKSGFTSVMFDGSKLPFVENYAQTQKIVNLARLHNVSVEAEVGIIGGKKDDDKKAGELADINECQQMAQLGITSLAAGIGNIHGVYPSDWTGLNFDHLTKIAKAVNGLPLVLHGGSGVSNAQLARAIKMGVNKINVGTDLMIVFSKALAEYFLTQSNLNKKGYDPRTYIPTALLAIEKLILDKLQLIGSFNKFK